MKDIFENWKLYMKEEQDTNRSFVFSKEEIGLLNKSIAKIIGNAKKVLGTDGPSLMITPDMLEKTALDPQQQDATPLRKVAENEEAEVDDELAAFRKQYYGDDGEIAKSGPKMVKDAPKGLGQMSVDDFEESGFVMKVPKEVLDDFQMLVEETKKTDELYAQARDWYHNIRELLDNETNDDRDSALMGLMIATYSPRNKFALNLAEAVFMYKAVADDAARRPDRLREYLETFPGAEKRTAGEPRGFTGAHKVPNFALNLIAPSLAGERDPDTGELKYNDFYKWNSTIDTWMIDAFYPMLKRASTQKEWEAMKGKLMSTTVSYRYMTELVSQEAKKLGILPHELQAIIWVSMQIRQTGVAGLGVTTQFAFNQIKEAITNIRTINVGLEGVKQELEEKSWLGVMLDEIDNKGFAEAAKFVLGLKDEKDKVATSGVRSIASKGKKGDAFKYYPAPPKVAKPKKPKGPSKEKEVPAYTNPEFSDLSTWYVMNEVVQMPTGKFNNLYDSVILYLDPDFSTQKAVDYILGRFNPEATSSKDYFTEGVIRVKVLRSKRS